MPNEITVKFNDNSSYTYENVPGSVTKDQAISRAKKDFPNKSIIDISREIIPETKPEIIRNEPPTIEQSFLGGSQGAILKGMKDPLDAGAQILNRVMPTSVTDVVDYIPSKLRESKNPYVSKVAQTFLADPRKIDSDVAEAEQKYQEARQATALIPGQPGNDYGRLLGNALNPVTAVMARVTPAGATSTLPRQLGTGVGLGFLSGLSSPVTNPADQKDFLETKATQGVIGSSVGALFPIASMVSKAVAPLVNRLIKNFGPNSGSLVSKTDDVINEALKNYGQTINDVSPDVLNPLRQKVASAFKTGKSLNPNEVLRSEDFSALGLTPTRGQVTRNPTFFAQERNLRGVSGVGEPLAARFDQQNKVLQEKIGTLAGTASDKVTAGERIASALKLVDEEKRLAASAAYKAAEKESGIKAEVPLTGLAQDIAEIQERYGSDLPDAIVNSFKKYGIFGAKKTHILTMQDAENIMQQTNKLRGNDPARNNALKEVNDAVKRAISETSESGGPFAAPRALSRERFKAQEEIPALKAVAENSVSPDDFVRKYVFDAPSAQVIKMAELLKNRSPQAFSEARAQIGDEIRRAAFGENVAGDAIISPSRLASKIRQIGPQRLKAFFSNEEIDELNRIVRVSSYINSTPGAAPVNYSNTAAQVASDLLGWIPSALKGAFRETADQIRVNNALNYKPKPALGPKSEKAARAAAVMSTMGLAQSESRGK